MQLLKKIIEEAYEKKHEININNINSNLLETIEHIIQLLNDGKIRIAEKKKIIYGSLMSG